VGSAVFKTVSRALVPSWVGSIPMRLRQEFQRHLTAHVSISPLAGCTAPRVLRRVTGKMLLNWEIRVGSELADRRLREIREWLKTRHVGQAFRGYLKSRSGVWIVPRLALSCLFAHSPQSIIQESSP